MPRFVMHDIDVSVPIPVRDEAAPYGPAIELHETWFITDPVMDEVFIHPLVEVTG